MVLDDINMLQADATVFAGLLLLVVILYALLPRSSQQVGEDIASLAASKISIVTISIVIPFSASAILVILGNISQISQIVPPPLVVRSTTSGMLVNFGKYAMVFGFGSLAVGIIWLVKSMIRHVVRMQKGQDKDKKYRYILDRNTIKRVSFFK